MKKLCVLLLALTLSGCSLLDVLSEPAVDLNGGGETATFSPSNETMNYHYHQLSEEEQRLYGLLLPALCHYLRTSRASATSWSWC